MNVRVLRILCFLIMLGSVPVFCNGGRREASIDLGSQRPLLAVWSCEFGEGGESNLRIAIWTDGRILFAVDPKEWGDKFQEGKIPLARIADLKKRIPQTGVFTLKHNAYLVPDGGLVCILADVGGRRQVLYWDEFGENPPLKFRNCWASLNQLALDSRPTSATPVQGRFDRAPRSWYAKGMH